MLRKERKWNHINYNYNSITTTKGRKRVQDNFEPRQTWNQEKEQAAEKSNSR